MVRAKAFKTGALPSAIVTRTFFSDVKGRARYTVPVISLATESANFFDPDIGIYVPGNAPGGNYSQRGNNWERPVHVEFFETAGALALAQDAGVKIHGNTSQNFPIKGLDLDGTGGQGPCRQRLLRREAELVADPRGHAGAAGRRLEGRGLRRVHRERLLADDVPPRGHRFTGQCGVGVECGGKSARRE